METHSRLHGKSQPRLLQTYLFMKYEVMKKVLNPTSVNSNRSQQVSKGPQGAILQEHPCQHPWEGTEDSATHTPPHKPGSRRAQTGKAAQPLQSPKLRWGF